MPVSSTAQPSDGLSTLDVLRAINPHALQSGMDSAAATQVSNMLSVWPQRAAEMFMVIGIARSWVKLFHGSLSVQGRK